MPIDLEQLERLFEYRINPLAILVRVALTPLAVSLVLVIQLGEACKRVVALLVGLANRSGHIMERRHRERMKWEQCERAL